MNNSFIKKYLTQLKSDEGPYVGGFIQIKDEILKEVIQNVNVLTFDSFYPTVSVLLFDEKLIPETELENIEKIKKYLFTKDPNLKIFANSYFGHLYNINKKLPGYVAQMAHFIIKDIYEKNENTIYADTDQIFYTTGDLNLFGINLKYNKTKYDYLLMDARKRYVFAIDNKFISKGYSRRPSRNQRENKMLENNISKIKSHIRDSKLNEILQ